MTFGMSQSHYQFGFCAYAVYSMQAETVETHEGWLLDSPRPPPLQTGPGQSH